MAPEVQIVQGDLTTEEVDAVVNAANEALLGGGGVDGAIHRAAGPELLAACRALPLVHGATRCPTGEARLTEAFALPARFVIHAVGPRYHMPDAPALLASAFRSSLTIASEHREIRSVALPAVSCGVYGYPLREAARVAMAVVLERPWALEEIRFVLFSDEAFDAFADAFEGALGPGSRE